MIKNIKGRFLFVFIFLFSMFGAVNFTAAQYRPTIIYFFYGDGCPHCAKEEVFLDRLEKERLDVEIKRYEIWNSEENQKLLQKIAKELGIRTSAVPVTIINGQVVYGYSSEETTGREIERVLDICKIKHCPDPVAAIIGGEPLPPEEIETATEAPATPSPETSPQGLPLKVKLPFAGEIDAKALSLPVLTVLIGGLDGFNPCAMWVLLFLISLLLGMKNRRRMWILGGSFITASAFVYLLFMAAWLQLFLFLGLVLWVRLAIGVVALATGGYHLKEFWTNPQGACKVGGPEKKKKVFEKIKKVIQEKHFWLALGGIILLAFAVNLIELLCSAGLPAVYTQVLTMSRLPFWQYYLYLLLYIFIFMLDDMVVFIGAMLALRATGLSGKYSRFSSLVGGIIMLIIGALLLLKPEWLMFG